MGFIGVTVIYVGFLALTNPYKLPITMLILPSVLLGLVLYMFVRLIQSLNILKANRMFAVLLPVYGVLLSLLASLQQLIWRDAIIAGVLLWIFAFYFNRIRPKS